MNFIKNVQVFIGVLLLQPFGHYCGHHSNDIITSALQVAIDLYNENHTEHEFLSMIQTLFCPDQPVCINQPDVTESSDALSSDFTTSRGAYQRDIIKSLKHCCLPCSCDDVTCSENDNCCLTKQAISFETAQTPAETTIKTACIAATSRSYFSKHTLENTYSRYSMVTRCFKNRDNATLVTRCEQPGIYDITADVTIPVFSLTTGRTYWNIYCAICQNDTQDLVTWNATVYLRRNYFIFSHRSRPVTAANNFSYFYSEVVNAGEVIYTKPSETEPNVCLPKDAIEDVDVTIFHPLCHEHKFLQVACQNFDSPSLINSLRGARAYKNVFCLLCQTGSTSPKKEADCRLDVYRGLPPSYVALLNQKLTVNGSLSGSNSIEPTSQQECPCNTILDRVQHICRPLFCPPNEYMELCKCIPFTSTTSGMPYLLLIKLQALKRPMLGHQADDFLALSAAVRKALGTRYKRIVFETVAIFYSNFTENTYLLHVIRAREERRYDAKNSAFKELAQYLEGPPFLRLVSRKSKYDAKLTNSIIIWTDPVGVYRASDTKTDLELHEVFTDDELVITLRWSQELSKLLFCKQVELNDTEYSEKHGVVSINVSSIDYHTTHYFHTAINKIRICTEDFRKGFPMASSSFTLPNFTVAVYLGFLLWCFLV